MSNRIAIIGVHGIELSLPFHWMQSWVRAIELGTGHQFAWHDAVTYDHLQPKQRSWFWRLLGDTGAIGNPRIERYVDGKLGLCHMACVADGARPVIIAHSLGTLLVHQSLLRSPLHGVTLITLGSPPRLRNILGLSGRPRGIDHWLNIYSPLLDTVVLSGELLGADPVLPAADENIRVHCRHPALTYLKRRTALNAIKNCLS